MTFKGVELAFSAVANEILRELKTPFFSSGNTDHTQFHGLCEGVLVMYLIASGKRSNLAEFIRMGAEDRRREVLDFAIEHEEEIEAIKPGLIARMESAIAAQVESEAGGKSHSPVPEPSP